jgi:hypothetical protein
MAQCPSCEKYFASAFPGLCNECAVLALKRYTVGSREWLKMGVWARSPGGAVGRVIKIQEPTEADRAGLVVVFVRNLAIYEESYDRFFKIWTECSNPFEAISVWDHIAGEDWI